MCNTLHAYGGHGINSDIFYRFPFALGPTQRAIAYRRGLSANQRKDLPSFWGMELKPCGTESRHEQAQPKENVKPLPANYASDFYSAVCRGFGCSVTLRRGETGSACVTLPNEPHRMGERGQIYFNRFSIDGPSGIFPRRPVLRSAQIFPHAGEAGLKYRADWFTISAED